MNNKFNMPQEDNIFFAKRKLVDNIYISANLEGIKISLPETVEFMNNVNKGTLSIEEIFKLKDLKDSGFMSSF